MEPHKDLKELLGEALDLKNLNHEKLAELTGVPERFIWAIQNVEVDKLPPAPYVRGYIKKISNILKVNHDELWDLYKKELEHKRSGAYDKLPDNRFAIKHISKNKRLLITFGVLLVIYLIFNFSRMIGETDLTITSPNTELITVNEENYTIIGETKQQNKVSINGKEIFVNYDGTFSKDITLEPGSNIIEIKAQKLLGRENIITKHILYQPLLEEDQQNELLNNL
ncbi:hypothetical protein GW950_01910 [Candidatus Wolfebacteria bacterium]|nr:hypothetical protein [Candidatus Wolfebacteria bacterium]